MPVSEIRTQMSVTGQALPNASLIRRALIATARRSPTALAGSSRRRWLSSLRASARRRTPSPGCRPERQPQAHPVGVSKPPIVCCSFPIYTPSHGIPSSTDSAFDGERCRALHSVAFRTRCILSNKAGAPHSRFPCWGSNRHHGAIDRSMAVEPIWAVIHRHKPARCEYQYRDEIGYTLAGRWIHAASHFVGRPH